MPFMKFFSVTLFLFPALSSYAAEGNHWAPDAADIESELDDSATMNTMSGGVSFNPGSRGGFNPSGRGGFSPLGGGGWPGTRGGWGSGGGYPGHSGGPWIQVAQAVPGDDDAAIDADAIRRAKLRSNIGNPSFWDMFKRLFRRGPAAPDSNAPPSTPPSPAPSPSPAGPTDPGTNHGGAVGGGGPA